MTTGTSFFSFLVASFNLFGAKDFRTTFYGYLQQNMRELYSKKNFFVWLATQKVVIRKKKTITHYKNPKISLYGWI